MCSQYRDEARVVEHIRNLALSSVSDKVCGYSLDGTAILRQERLGNRQGWRAAHQAICFRLFRSFTPNFTVGSGLSKVSTCSLSLHLWILSIRFLYRRMSCGVEEEDRDGEPAEVETSALAARDRALLHSSWHDHTAVFFSVC